jgi:HEAT repeat protein
LQAIYQVYATNLGSRDDEIQREAERAIVSGAPPWLEDTIVGMVRKSTSREFALLGLRNLNTPRAREELANIARETSGYTEQSELAIRYLAEMGDKKYFPLLLETAKQQEPREAREYVEAAAELGGADALPYLRELLKSTDKFARANGVAGLEKTGSREAVPLLIETLKSGDADLGKLALIGLTELTHRNTGDVSGDAPKDQAEEWEKWWAANGARAKIYGVKECGEVERLR